MRRLPLVVVAIVILSGAAATASSADTTTTTSTSLPTTTMPVHHRRVAALTGLPDPTAVTKRRSALRSRSTTRPWPIRSTASTKPTSSTRRSSRAASPGSPRSSTRTCRPRSARCARCGAPTVRSSFRSAGSCLLRRRPVRHHSIETAPVKLIHSRTPVPRCSATHAPPPHNLFANAVLLMIEGGKVHTPPASSPSAPQPPAGVPRSGPSRLNFESGFATSYQWDAKTYDWLRSILRGARRDRDGVRCAAPTPRDRE